MIGSYENPFRFKDIQAGTFISAVNEAKELWTAKCKEFTDELGDRGTCVMGAGIAVYVIPKGCRNPKAKTVIKAHEVTYAQGSSVWETSKNEVIKFLATKGIEAFYEPGFMD